MRVIEVKKIVVAVGDVSLELSQDEAEKLRQTLDNLLGKQQVFYPVYTPVFQQVFRPYPWTGSGVGYQAGGGCILNNE